MAISAQDDRPVQWLQPHRHLDAITAFRKISGEGTILDDPALPQAVQGPLSDSPNAFSDGSFASPTLSAFGLASAAVWYPQRAHNVTDLERLHSMHCYDVAGQYGVVIFGYLDGYKSSSARIELVGLILSLFLTCLSTLPLIMPL